VCVVNKTSSFTPNSTCLGGQTKSRGRKTNYDGGVKGHQRK
jgi:hypothetical protein